MKAIVNGVVYTPNRVISPGTIVIDGREILLVGSEDAVNVPAGAEIIDAEGRAVVPGFIDVHMHGAMGHDAMGPELADVIRRLPEFGVTGFVGTTLTLPKDETFAGLEAMAEVLASPPAGARCLGIHLEGPFLSPEEPGMATSEWFEPFNWERFQQLQALAGGHIRMLTFAPEEGEGLEAIPRLQKAEVIPVVGHSDATFEQIAEAVDLGLNHATHTFNAMPPFHHRRPGVVGAVMYFQQIVAELIADGVHIHPAVMAILLRVKGLDRVALVSDSSPLAGLPEGEYEWEHKSIYVKDGACRLEDGTIAGAHALLDTGVRNLVKMVGLPLEEALVPATRVPADVLGVHKGRLLPGYDADVVLLDEGYNAALTLVEGEIVHRA